MHPEVTDSEASSCPKCGMKLVSADKVPGACSASTLMTTLMGSNGKT